jgi:hypothetical protein
MEPWMQVEAMEEMLPPWEDPDMRDWDAPA